MVKKCIILCQTFDAVHDLFQPDVVILLRRGRFLGHNIALPCIAPLHGLELGNFKKHGYFLTSLKGKSMIDLSLNCNPQAIQKNFTGENL